MEIDRTTFLMIAGVIAAVAACSPVARSPQDEPSPKFKERPPMTASSKTPREVWEQIAAYQQTRDINGYMDSFAADAVKEWPFTPQGFPRRLEGRDAIHAHVGPTWERAKKTNRQITGHDRAIIHET